MRHASGAGTIDDDLDACAHLKAAAPAARWLYHV
jgi:hypothetical protein